MPTKTTEEIEGVEELNTLPVNDPQAGYLPPKPHEGFATGVLPPAEQEILDQQIDDWQEQAQAVKEAEEKALEEREGQQAKDAEALRAWQEEHGFVPPAFEAPSVKAAQAKTTSKSGAADDKS